MAGAALWFAKQAEHCRWHTGACTVVFDCHIEMVALSGVRPLAVCERKNKWPWARQPTAYGYCIHIPHYQILCILTVKYSK